MFYVRTVHETITAFSSKKVQEMPSTNKIYGFFNVNDFILNQYNTVSAVGELSPIGYTYNREEGFYDTAIGKLIIHHKDLIGTQTDDDFIAIVNNDLKLRVDAAVTGLKNAATGDVLATVVNNGLTSVTGDGTIGTVTLGALVFNNIDNKNYPSSITFDYTNNGLTWEVQIWLADTNFLDEYPKFQLEVILPLDNMSILYNDFANAKPIIEGLAPTFFIDRINMLIDFPYTSTMSFNMLARNKDDYTVTTSVPFVIVYNGNKSKFTSSDILQAIRDKILASTPGIGNTEWMQVFPGWNSFSTYVILPRWDKIAINDNSTSPPSIYQPGIQVFDPLNIVSTYLSEMDTTDIGSYFEYVPVLYKSLGVYIVAAPDAITRKRFTEAFPDYALICLNDNAFYLISEETRNLIGAMDQLIRLSETYLPGDALPNGYFHTTRESKDYLYTVVNGTVQIMALTKASFDTM